jgi:hypothetical protein
MVDLFSFGLIAVEHTSPSASGVQFAGIATTGGFSSFSTSVVGTIENVKMPLKSWSSIQYQ